jgi:hypothetical protein
MATKTNQLMPEGTRLNSVKTEKGLCVVDFSEEFYKNGRSPPPEKGASLFGSQFTDTA